MTIPKTGPGDGVAPGSITSGPDGALWVADGQGTIDRITTAGAVTEFLDPAGFGGSITDGPDGALWLAGEVAGNPLQRITTAGVITDEGTITGEGGGITAGPGARSWWTCQPRRGRLGVARRPRVSMPSDRR